MKSMQLVDFWICCILYHVIGVVHAQSKSSSSSTSSTSSSSSSSSSGGYSLSGTTTTSSGGGSSGSSSQQKEYAEEYVRVTLPTLGTAQGVRAMGLDFFGGIPFAAPPVGNLRWAPPQNTIPWKPHVLDATQFGPDCYQLHDPTNNPLAEEQHMSEDCLYLNVYTPAGASSLPHTTTKGSKHNKKPKTKGLPVLVWFHGGAFQQGSGKRPEYDGRRLAQEEMVVVVTVNYRLGALGFLVKSDLGLYGNYGLMDQRAALFWVQEYINVFGGDPDSVTVFGESAGAVTIGLHLQMRPTLFHRAILQSNPMGYQFRSIVVADFLGDAMMRAVDCRDLECMRSEPVQEITRAQSSLMGIPRSVGDFFTWGPVLTQERHVSWNGRDNSFIEQQHSVLQQRSLFASGRKRESSKYDVNVTQPLIDLHLVPDSIPIIIGTNRHEGEMFVHGAFPLTMSKPVYWMFVGALFRDSAARVLKHYRPFVAQLEAEAEAIAEDQLTEEENKQYYMENAEELQQAYQEWMQTKNQSDNSTTSNMDYEVMSPETIEQLVKTFSSGGGHGDGDEGEKEVLATESTDTTVATTPWWKKPANPFRGDPEKLDERRRLKQEKQRQAKREKALREAAKVVVDYRPVMSAVINDYLFRCPSWHYAHLLSRNRVGHNINNVFVYRFSQPTHVPGFRECWGKSCHTSELPYMFRSMDVIRTNYSTLSEIAQREAPAAPSYPYTEMLEAHFRTLEPRPASASLHRNGSSQDGVPNNNKQSSSNTTTTTKKYSGSFQRIIKYFFDDYFMEDADEEIASDIAQRWVAFARSGNPNYDDSKVEWIPWRYIPKEEEVHERDLKDYIPWDGANSQEELSQDFWSDVEDEYGGVVDDYGQSWSEDEMGRAYRRRALLALSMEVIEEDPMRTELKRTKSSDPDNPFFALKFLAKLGVSWKEDGDETGKTRRIPKSTIRQVQRIAQEMGVLGSGLQGDYDRTRGNRGEYWEDDFFPQLLELKWPPEGRLVERDCTCDLWERIGSFPTKNLNATIRHGHPLAGRCDIRSADSSAGSYNWVDCSQS